MDINRAVPLTSRSPAHAQNLFHDRQRHGSHIPLSALESQSTFPPTSQVSLTASLTGQNRIIAPAQAWKGQGWPPAHGSLGGWAQTPWPIEEPWSFLAATEVRTWVPPSPMLFGGLQQGPQEADQGGS